MKIATWIVGIGIASLLTACHENPLSSHSRQQNVDFLREAAISAEKTMKLPARKGGRFYSNCMEGNHEWINCTEFFNEMLRFAKNNPNYRDLTHKELTDPKTYASIAEDYQVKLFNTIDY